MLLGFFKSQKTIHDVAASGNLEGLETLLATSVDVNARDADGYTALMIASKNGHLEIVRALLAAQADEDATTPDGIKAIDYLIRREITSWRWCDGEPH